MRSNFVHFAPPSAKHALQTARNSKTNIASSVPTSAASAQKSAGKCQHNRDTTLCSSEQAQVVPALCLAFELFIYTLRFNHKVIKWEIQCPPLHFLLPVHCATLRVPKYVFFQCSLLMLRICTPFFGSVRASIINPLPI
jgi:hypothetical protein